MHLMLLWGCPGASENSKCINNKVNCQHLKSQSLQTNLFLQTLKDACDSPKKVCAHRWAINLKLYRFQFIPSIFIPLAASLSTYHPQAPKSFLATWSTTSVTVQSQK